MNFEQQLKSVTASSGGTPSRHPLRQLRQAIKINLYWTAAISLSFIVPAVLMPHPIISSLFLLIFLWCIWTFRQTYHLYQNTGDHINPDNPILQEIKTQVASFEKWKHSQQTIAKGIYPLSATAGFLLGGASGSQLPPQQFMTKPIVLAAWVISTIVLSIGSHYLSEFLFQKAFGKQLNDLKQLIAEMEDQA